MATTALAAPPAIGLFERYLSLRVALCIVAGIALGFALPDLLAAIAAAEVARVNLVVAVLIWLMIVPMLLKIDFGALGSVRQHWKGVGVTLFINWAVEPFSMALLGALFIGWLFAPWLPAGEGPLSLRRRNDTTAQRPVRAAWVANEPSPAAPWSIPAWIG